MACSFWRLRSIQAGILFALFDKACYESLWFDYELSLVSTTGCVLSIECPDTWVTFQGSCYLFGTDNPLSFFESEHFCRQHGGHLVHVDNSVENAFIKNFLASLKPAHHWVGVTDERVEGVWTWYDTNTTPSFADWAPGEPNNSNNQEDCGIFDYGYKFKWDDVLCTSTYEPVCEIRNTDSEVVVG